MKPYEKTQADIDTEAWDLENNPIMKWLQHQDAFRFNIGDVVIRKNLRTYWDPQSHMHGKPQWDVETTSSTTKVPKKYVYVFENSLGIGYLRQLKVDGSGFTSTMTCVTSFDPVNTRLELDPDYAEHQLIGDGDFEYQQEYTNKRLFRTEAMARNKKICVKTLSHKDLNNWFLGLKVGDEFWSGHTFDDLERMKYKIIKIYKAPKPQLRKNWSGSVDPKDLANDALGAIEWQKIQVEVLNHPYEKAGSKLDFEVGEFARKKVSMIQPFPMQDPLCAPAK